MGLLHACFSFRTRPRHLVTVGLLIVAAFSIYSLSYSFSYRLAGGPPRIGSPAVADRTGDGDGAEVRQGQPVRPFTPLDPPPLRAGLQPGAKDDEPSFNDVLGPPPADIPIGHPAFKNPGAPPPPPEKKPGESMLPGLALTLDDLLKLPVLHHAPRKPRPIPSSSTPWDNKTERGAKVLELLSAERFPFERDEGVLAWKGMLPPEPPRWPDPATLLPRAKSFAAPIPLQDVFGLLSKDEGGRAAVSDQADWWQKPSRSTWDPADPGWKPKPLPRVQWKGFAKAGWETSAQRKEREQRRAWVRRGFAHVWEGYKRTAWGHDELKPVTGSTEDPFSGWGATLVDSLDTLLIMNLTREYNYARTHVRSIDWSQTVDMRQVTLAHRPYAQQPGGLAPEPTVPFFETVIRYVGGLIGAYDLSGDKLMLDRVEELARWLLPAFGTASGIPNSRYTMGGNPGGMTTRRVILAEVGSLSLEFTRLAQLTGKAEYFHVIQRITDVLDSADWDSPQRLGKLFPTYIDPEIPSSLGGIYTIGAMSDSFWEYLIKQHQLTRGVTSQYGRMYQEAADSVHEHLLREVEIEPVGELEDREPRNFTVLCDSSWGQLTPRVEHLACFAGGMFALGGKLLDRADDADTSTRLTDTCVWAYESTPLGVGPEWINLFREADRDRWIYVKHNGQDFRQIRSGPMPGVRSSDGRYLGRPETIESVLYMWRTTGDRQWQDRGWRMFVNWMEASITPTGFADISSVHTETPTLLDKAESFVLAETFKYYYCLFSEPDFISLDDFVFNTEAHPLRIPRSGRSARVEPAYLWEGEEAEVEAMFEPPAGIKAGKEAGWGTFMQVWAKTDPNEVTGTDLEFALRPRPAKQRQRPPTAPMRNPGGVDVIDGVAVPVGRHKGQQQEQERPAWSKNRKPRPPSAPEAAAPGQRRPAPRPPLRPASPQRPAPAAAAEAAEEDGMTDKDTQMR